MHRLFAVLCLALAPLVAVAQQTTLTAGGATIIVPPTVGYTLVSDGSDPSIAIYATTPVEPWEEIGEFSEQIIIIAIPFASDDPEVIAERFAAMFNSLYTFAQADRAGTPFQVDTTLVNEGLFNDLAAFSAAGRASSITVSANSDAQKAMVFDTGFTMPGVITYPLVEEFSLVLVSNVMVVIRSQRVTIDLTSTENLVLDPRMTDQLRTTGAALRDGLLAAN